MKKTPYKMKGFSGFGDSPSHDTEGNPVVIDSTMSTGDPMVEKESPAKQNLGGLYGNLFPGMGGGNTGGVESTFADDAATDLAAFDNATNDPSSNSGSMTTLGPTTVSSTLPKGTEIQVQNEQKNIT